MKLYHSPASPYVRKVMILLHETGQIDDVEVVPVATTVFEPDAVLAGKTPLRKIPALERADGPTLFDSRVITAYLDARAGSGLYGGDKGSWEIRTLEALGDGMMDAALLMAYERRFRPEDKQSDDWVDAQWSKIERSLSALEAQWMPLLAGPLNAGQIAVAAALGYVDFRHGAREWRKGHTALADWFAVFSERESMRLTVPPEA